MEFCVNRITGKILASREDGANWGSGESYSVFLIHGHEEGRWEDQRLMVIKVPDLSDADGHRYRGGKVSINLLEENTDKEPTLSLFDWTAIATIAVEIDPEIP